jgi:peptide/nickel transport system substrate-binding protein
MSLPRRALLLAAGATPIAPAWAMADAASDAGRLVCPLAADPAALVPGVSDAAATRLVGSQIYRGLCRFDADNQPQPDLAQSCTISPDGLTYRFALQPGVTWHDGAPFTAEDVVFSLDRFHRALTPRLPLDRVASFVAVDAQTAVLTLKASFEPWLRQLDALCAPIVPKHVHDRPDWGIDPRRVIPVGTGPFRFDGWLRLVRFDWYAGPKPALQEIDFPVLPDLAARMTAMASGQPGLLVADAVERAAIQRFRQVEAFAVEGAFPPVASPLVFLKINRTAKPLDDPRVRLALATAINRAAILQEAFLGLGRVATGPARATGAAPPGLPAYDPRAASTLLTAAGLRPGDDGVRARLRHLVPAGEPWPIIAKRLALALGQIGIDVATETVDAQEWQRRVAAGDYDLAAVQADQTGDPVLDLRPYAGELPPLAALLDAGKLVEAHSLVVADMTALWLVEPAIPVVRDRRLHLPGGIYRSFADATIA